MGNVASNQLARCIGKKQNLVKTHTLTNYNIMLVFMVATPGYKYQPVINPLSLSVEKSRLPHRNQHDSTLCSLRGSVP